MAIVKFEEFELSGPLMRGLAKMGFRTATDVQARAIAPMMTGADLMVQSPTGTGKTCAFGIPVIEGIDPDNYNIQTLILCPTRELATQTASVLKRLAVFKPGIRVQAIYGGESIERQILALKKRPQIIVATPGRLIDHIDRRTTRLGGLKLAVLDEADRMLDMGFRPALDRILKTVPEERQTVMFSATMSPSIQAIAQAYQKNVQRILLEQETLTVDSVRQYYAQVEKKDKESTLARLIKDERFDLSLVFVARKHRAADVARALNANGIRAAALHGDLRQSQRDRVMGSYRSGELDVLVATDVAARGIDVKNIDAVINFDIPQDGESYVHRIGRTGRAAETGVSYTFVMSEEMGDMKAIMRLTHTDVARINLQLLDGFVSGKGKKAVTPALVGVVNRPDAFERVLRTENRRQQTTERPASSGRKRRSRGQKRTRYA